MSIQEIVGEFRKMPLAAKVSGILSPLIIITGCGDSGKVISDCPVDYYRDHAPVKRAELLAGMRSGTVALRNEIRLAGHSDRNVSAADIGPNLRPAAESIFRVDESASVLEGETVLIIGGPRTDTNVDEIGELVCSANGGEYFPTLTASEAYANLQVAGIDIMNNRPEPVKSGAAQTR